MMGGDSDARKGGPDEPSRDGGESGRSHEDREARLRRARESAARSEEASSPILLPGGNAPESGFWRRWKTPLLVVASCVALGATALGLVPVLSDDGPEEFPRIEGLPQEWEQVRAEPPGQSGTPDAGEPSDTGAVGTETSAGGAEAATAGEATPAEGTPPGGETTSPGGGAPAQEEGEAAPADTSAENPPSSPALRELDLLADSLSTALARYGERRQDFELNRLQCTGLSRGYRQVDEAYLAFLRAYESARVSLDASRRSAYQQLMEDTDQVNRHFDGTRCPRPE